MSFYPTPRIWNDLRKIQPSYLFCSILLFSLSNTYKNDITHNTYMYIEVEVENWNRWKIFNPRTVRTVNTVRELLKNIISLPQQQQHQSVYHSSNSINRSIIASTASISLPQQQQHQSVYHSSRPAVLHSNKVFTLLSVPHTYWLIVRLIKEFYFTLYCTGTWKGPVQGLESRLQDLESVFDAISFILNFSLFLLSTQYCIKILIRLSVFTTFFSVCSNYFLFICTLFIIHYWSIHYY